MFGRKIRSPFHGEPQTKLKKSRKKGRYFEVKLKYLTPMAAKWCDAFALTCAVGGGFYIFMNVASQGLPPIYYMAAVGLPAVFYHPFKTVVRDSNRKTTKVRISAHEFERCGFGGFKLNNRLEHAYSIRPHDKAEEERELLNKRRNPSVKNVYYGKSYWLTYEYLNQRYDIAEIYGQREAEQALARLHACDEHIRGGMNAETPNPNDDWQR